MKAVITDYQITDHGVEHSQYWQGAGVSCSKWVACYTGIGDSPAEALEDALESVAMDGVYDLDSLPAGWDEGLLTLTDDRVSPIIAQHCDCDACVTEAGEPQCSHDCECFRQSELHYFVTLYVK